MAKQDSTKKRILLISSHSFEGSESYDWFQELPNISDYDIVILDSPRIFTFWSLAGRLDDLGNNTYLLSHANSIDEKVQSNISLVRKKLLEILEFNVKICALHTPNSYIWTTTEYYHGKAESSRKGIRVVESKREHFVDVNDWCPIGISIFAEKGKTIIINDEEYEEYFRDFDSWQYYFVPDSLNIGKLENTYSSKYKVTPQVNVIAVNKVDKPIAIEFIPQFHRWREPERDSWRTVADKEGGRLVLLPVADMYNTQSLIEILLRQIKEVEVMETPSPSWIGTVEIPGEACLKNAVDTATQALMEAESRVKESEARLDELQNYKKLLYETGLPLQELVKSTLRALGANTKPSVVTDEFIIESNGKEALIEVKGNTKSITKDDVAQLVTDLMQHLKTTGQEIHGILVGNAWRLLPLQERNVKDKPIFSRDAIRVAKNHNIGLISTTELFRAFCRTLEEPAYKKDVMNKTTTRAGVITFLPA